MHEKFFKREEIKGKLIISQEAKINGEVKDIAISKNGNIGLLIKQGEDERIISLNEVQKIDDVVLLKKVVTSVEKTIEKPEFEKNSEENICVNCGRKNRQDVKFCVYCGKPI